MIEVLLNPRGFFEPLIDRKPRVWIGFGVFFLAVFLAAVASQLATRNLPTPMGLGNPWVFTVIGALLGALVFWGLLGLLVMLLSGMGSRAYELVGWAAAPGVVVGLVLVALAAVLPVQGTLPPAPAGDPAQLGAWLDRYQELVGSATFSKASQYLSAAASLWGAWILFAGTQVFARGRAVLVTAAYLALQLGMYLLGNVRLGG